MIWHYFPIGLRFPVADFSVETKRRCWQIALSALAAGDAEQVALYEAMTDRVPRSGEKEYICILCHETVAQSRRNAAVFHARDRLLAYLTVDAPFLQANALESFGPYGKLGMTLLGGTVQRTEASEAFLPESLPSPMPICEGRRMLFAMDAMKGVCTAERLTRCLAQAAVEQGFRVRMAPIADGGEGTVMALVAGRQGRFETVFSNDLNGVRVPMTVGVLPNFTAVVESADAVGFCRLSDATPAPEERSTFGVGTLIKAALDLGYRKIWIGLGGTLTTDLGLGCLQALGAKFFNAYGAEVAPLPCNFFEISDVDLGGLDERLKDSALTALADVNTPLCGERGALAVFGAQKGLTPQQIAAWEPTFLRLSALLGGDVTAEGTGAAGGLGFGLQAIGATLVSGADAVLDAIGFDALCNEADLVVTGEGKFDLQSVLCHKAPQAVLTRCAALERPAWLLTGVFTDDAKKELATNRILRGVTTCCCGQDDAWQLLQAAFLRDIAPIA